MAHLSFLRPKPDTLVGYIAAMLIVAYVVAYGWIQLDGFRWDSFGWQYLAILVPIWVIDGVKTSFEAFLPRQYKTAAEDISKVTVIIACKDGEMVIGNTLKSLRRKFPMQQVIVASNGSTDRTCEIARDYGAVCLDFKEPLGKVRAINAALPYVRTPYVLLLDDDTLIAGATIPTGLLDQGYDGVAFRVLVKLQTWVSYLQLHEYRKSFDIGRRYHNSRGSVQNISGAIGLFKLDVLQDQIQHHSGEFSGEDLQRTLLIHLAARPAGRRSKGVVLARSIVITVGPKTLPELFRQRIFGWFPGLYANFGNYLRIMFRPRVPMALRIDAFYSCFFVNILDVLRLLSLPIVVFYPWYFVVMYVSYVLMELIPYFRAGRVEPLSVILVYPLYGMFGLVTRLCAGVVFLYRRLVYRFGRLPYKDDYRLGSPKVKWLSAVLATCVIAMLLAVNAIENYSSVFTAYNTQGVHNGLEHRP